MTLYSFYWGWIVCTMFPALKQTLLTLRTICFGHGTPGYVMAKMEGYSSSSKQVNNKFEFHIGGFSGAFNVLQPVLLDFPGGTHHFIAGKNYEMTINADINNWWQHPHDIKISEHPVITSPGKFARDISENYAKMFRIEKITPGKD